jgi:hypothetical protein
MESKPKQIPVILAPPTAYFATFMVNRFCLTKEKGFTLGHFGLVNESGLLLDKFGCIFTDSMLQDLKENLVTYSGKIGTAKSKPLAWTPKIPDADSKITELSMSTYGVVDFIHLTNWEDRHAEICFWNYSKASLADHLTTKPEQPFQTWGLALLRCDIELQRAFLEALYPV